MNIKNRSVQMNNSKRCLFFIMVFLAVCRLFLEACRRITQCFAHQQQGVYIFVEV